MQIGHEPLCSRQNTNQNQNKRKTIKRTTKYFHQNGISIIDKETSRLYFRFWSIRRAISADIGPTSPGLVSPVYSMFHSVIFHSIQNNFGMKLHGQFIWWLNSIRKKTKKQQYRTLFSNFKWAFLYCPLSWLCGPHDRKRHKI